ncbi:MAG: carboxypeptidase-like regulatory domain-containing protein [Bryobacteraceae bacterium]|nr:carboxypeptidase-like regulatory domain-containing protein [Bryobacteraceae bacterium]MDW8377676.1 carboxypeptidase-like regulatory domain-containing protein [Bryobacterales bacterium]
MSLCQFAGTFFFIIFFVSVSSAQESRGSIAGKVLDPQGAVIAGASVRVTNLATNETRRTTTNETGYYEVNFLEPSQYSIAVEATGFKKLVRTGFEVNVGSRIDLDLRLELGQVAETVEVRAEAPILETSTASGGRVLDQRELINLPFSDLNPFALTALAPGMQWTGQPEYRRPFDNGGTSAFNTMGGVGQNEYTIDGMTVTGTGRRVGFIPPADSITEFKLETSNFDASQGFTSGAAINVSSRSGTNKFSGSLFNQHWQQRWNATGHFARENWNAAVAAGRISPNTPKQATGRSNNYGLMASGPVYLPKVFNGKDKFFWTFTWNGIRQSKAETTDAVNLTVPTMAMRQGDFSELLNAPDGARRFTIYDPRSARLEGNTVVRLPFPGNRGIPVLNPMYQFYVALFPTPNNVPGLVTPEQRLNYLASAMPKDEKFNSIVNRYDYIINEKNRVNVRWQWNDRLADEYDWTYETRRGLHSNGLTRINKGGNVNWLSTFSASQILDMNFGVSRFEEGSRNRTRIAFGPKDVGLPDYLEARAGANRTLPTQDFDSIVDVGGSYPVVGAIGSTYELRVQMTTIRNKHSFRYGWQERRHHWVGQGPGQSSGVFTWRNNWTRATNVDNVALNHAHDWASFMMGAPTGVAIDTNDSTFFSTPRRALFFQDDFRVNNRLRLALGLRYEAEEGIRERFHRGIAAPFLADLKLPITDAVQAAYAASPIPELPANQFRVVGGTAYLGTNGLNTATKGTHIFLPKVGLTYQINSKTVIRTGWGMYMDTLNSNNTRPDTFGYNQSTSTPVSNDAGLTFCCGIGNASSLAQGRTVVHDPFPVRPTANNTRFDEPLQRRLGAMPRVGRGFTSLPWNFRPALQHRWRFGIQRELMRNTLLDISYNGAYATIPVSQRIDFLPEQYFTKGNRRDQNNDNFLNANVPNPFHIRNLGALQSSDPVLYGYLAGQGMFTSTVIARNRLLRPFPHMGGVTGLRPGVDFKDSLGYNRYHDMQLLVEHRFTRGIQSSFMYTRASSTTADFYLNEFDPLPSSRVNNLVVPHRLAWTFLWETPFGKGRTYLKSGPLAYIVGNWNLSWIYQRQSGPATEWGNRFFNGDPNTLGELFKSKEMRSRDIRQWFDGSLAFRGSGALPPNMFEGRASEQPGSYHVRVFPVRLDSLRADGIRNWDVKVERVFPIMPERGFVAKFSVDLLNATNHTNFSAPVTDPTNGNFGRVTSQRGLPRVIQFNVRIEF